MLGLPWRESMYNHGDFQAMAAFGDVIWHMTDRANLTFGLRYTRDSKEFTWTNGAHETPELDQVVAGLDQAGFFSIFPIPVEAYRFSDIVFQVDTPVDGVTRKDTWSDVSPRLVLDYKVTPNMMMFGSVAKGYKAGGFNSVEIGSQFDNEDVWNVEAGIKSVYPGSGLMLNASVFHYIYNDKQAIALVTDVDGSGVPQYLVDTSDEQASGIDLEAQWKPIDHFALFASVAYINATYKDKMTRGTNPVDLSGEPTGEPYVSAALGASYGWVLGGAGGLDLSGRYAYRGESRCNADSTLQGTCQVAPNFKVGEATQRLDMRFAWNSTNEKYGLAAFVTNVLNDQYVTGVNNLTTDIFGTPFASISEPRMWGVEATISFN
jgi:iron complex outermembrane receptor protein